MVTQLGCDTHFSDPLASLALSTAAYRETARALHRLAHDAAGGRWVATGGGGYQWARVVPRAWTIYFAEMVDAALPDDLPESWIEAAEREAGYAVPSTLSEVAPADSGRNPAIDQVVRKVREVIFPYHGLAPESAE
jgi:acetoin utilization protein AcuC